jgi:hypothetical protein
MIALTAAYDSAMSERTSSTGVVRIHSVVQLAARIQTI